MAIPGGHVAVSQDPGVTVGNIAVWSGDGRLGDNAQFPATALARSTSSPANPTGNATTTPTMMGLAGSITPKSTGNVRITITGDAGNSVINDGAQMQVAYGTGAAPANAATATGTVGGAPSRRLRRSRPAGCRSRSRSMSQG
jgi:hypothetical protein